MSSIFLSASVPREDGPYQEQYDAMLIQAALRTFLYTVIGRKHLVFGGHPTITPLILAVCQDVGVDFDSAVTVYQSKFFQDIVPEVNESLKSVVWVPAAESRAGSLALLRARMIRANSYEVAAFIGGDDGIIEEYKAFRQHHRETKIIALHSPGGAAAKLPGHYRKHDELLNYVSLFASSLEISLNSERNLNYSDPNITNNHTDMGYTP